MATRPARKPSALAFQPTPSGVTMPAPVTTTRGGGTGGCLRGKSTASLIDLRNLNEVFDGKSNTGPAWQCPDLAAVLRHRRAPRQRRTHLKRTPVFKVVSGAGVA